MSDFGVLKFNFQIGQLGVGLTQESGISDAVMISFPHPITQISAGGRHSAALSSNKKLYFWGCAKNGRCGVPTDVEKIVVPTEISMDFSKGIDAGIVTEFCITQICCGWSHSMFLLENSQKNLTSLFTFGRGSHGMKKNIFNLKTFFFST